MPRVDFYILPEREQNRLPFVCKLCKKIWNLQHGLHVYLSSEEKLQRLDETLWTFEQASFLPHEVLPGKPPIANTVITLSSDAELLPRHREVCINLDDEVPTFALTFDRVAEVLCKSQELASLLQDRSKLYRDNGFTLEEHYL